MSSIADFLDSLRTRGFCGTEPTGADGSGAWLLSPTNTMSSTELRAGSTITVNWDLHYPHNGGFEVELYRLDGNAGDKIVPVERLACEKQFCKPSCGLGDCPVDGTANSVNITLPAGITCDRCLVRLSRQALEWGGSYTFKSCALVSITEDTDECNGCSGHGTCNQVRPGESRQSFQTSYMACIPSL